MCLQGNGFLPCSLLINAECAAEIENSSFVIYGCFVQLTYCPDSSGKGIIQIIPVMKKQELHFLTCHHL